MSIRQWLFLVYLAFLVLLSVCKSAEIFLPYIYQFEAFLGGDKWMHFKLALLLGFFAVSVFSAKKLVLVLLVLLIGLFVDEAMQYLLASRRFEWLDALYGVSGLLFGAFLGGGLLWFAHRVRNGNSDIVKNDD